MSRLIVVSNRLSLPQHKADTGGLAVALQGALKAQGGVWFGWSGKREEYPQTRSYRSGKVEYVSIDLDERDYQDFYVGFCNSLIWPLFHYRMELTAHTGEMLEAYMRVNRLFAKRIAGLAREEDLIWVQDYQLMLLGSHLRSMGMKQRLGFFLHIPFPVPEVLTALPEHFEIIKSLSAYDVVGFQTEADLHAFIRYVTELADGSAVQAPGRHVYEVHAFGRGFQAGYFPISIDTEALMHASEAAISAPQTEKLRQSLVGRDMIIGVDRLDYSKGLVRKMEAFHWLLQQYPQYNGKVSYVQITPPSRTDVEQYQELRTKLEAAAAHINGVNAEIDWVPIRYINKSFTHKTLAGFYRLARVGLVTPLRDGMNLVAKEYAACQNPDNPGVLVLSQFAGAAHELQGALIVNPFDVERVGEALREALSMPLDERKERHRAMMRVLTRRDITHWTDSFLALLKGRPVQDNMPIVLPEKTVPPIRPLGELLPTLAHTA